VLWLFWRWGLENYLPGLASNLDPPDLSLPRSEDYRHEPPVLIFCSHQSLAVVRLHNYDGVCFIHKTKISGISA
jgi:hypothetical protein